MKKIIALLLCLVLVFPLSACGKKNPAEETAAEPLKIMSLKGPTSMGLVKLYSDNEQNENKRYEASIVTAADEITAALISGKTDIAALPANAAAALYNKAGGFSVIAVNTLGVLYLVESGSRISGLGDLAGQTLYLTGKGTTPEYAIRYLLGTAGIEDQVQLEFCAEPAEVVSLLEQNPDAIALLPQPFVSSAQAQNQELRVALSLTEEWEKLGTGSMLVTGVTVARTEVLEKRSGDIAEFLKEYSSSVDYCLENPDCASELIASYGIVPKAGIAKAALPYCNIVCISGTEMQTVLSGYLQTLFDQNPAAVGGSMPADAFYGVNADGK